MRRIIIAIHGLGNKPKKNLLARWWKQALMEGLGRAGFSRYNIRFDMVYWADILYPKPLTPRVKDTENPQYLRERYIRSRQGSIIRKSSMAGFLYRFFDKALEKAFHGTRGQQYLGAISHQFLRLFVADLHVYYERKQKSLKNSEITAYEDIQQRLRDTLLRHKDEQILLIAHSMGSIVAFDVLTRFQSEVGIDTLVTIGSPLGLPNIKDASYLTRPSSGDSASGLHTPESIRSHWYNLSDPEDKVAMDMSLADDFIGNTWKVHPKDQVVNNDYEFGGKRNPHKSYGYLRSPEMAAIVGAYLKRKRFRRRGSGRKAILSGQDSMSSAGR